MLPPELRDLFEVQVEHIYLLAAPTESFVSFKVSKMETPEAMAGVHSRGWVLLLVDEASGVHDRVFEAAAGSMSGHNATTVLTGNPVRSSGFFFDAFHDMLDMWTTFHISCLDSDLCSADYIEQMKRQYGEDSNGYRVRVLGDFPLADDDTLIPYSLVDASLLRDVQAIGVRPIWGVDVARKGRDRCAVAIRRGNVLEPWDGTCGVKAWKINDTMTLVGRIVERWNATLPSEQPSEIIVDSIGIGGPVVDRLVQMGLPARGIAVNEATAIKERFANLKAELWWTAREWFEAKDVSIANDKALMAEIVRMEYGHTATEKILVQTKKSYAKANKGISPDLADAFILTFASTAVAAGGGEYGTSRAPLRRIIRGLN